MPIVGLNNFASGDDGDRADGTKLPPHGPGGIYHEKQIGSLCAVHCVNNMLQGPLFSEIDFHKVAMQLDSAERRLMEGGGDLDYGNARMDGFFNVQVMQTVLNHAGYEMQPLKGEAGRSAEADTAKENAFILNKREHWFALRRIGREWFDLNSCLKTPRHYTDGDLRFHIRDAVREGYMVFVVRGDFPRSALEEDPKKLVEAVQGCGRPDQGYSLFAGSGNRLDAPGGSAAAGPAAAGAAAAKAAPANADALRAARLARFGGGGGPAPASPPVESPPAAPPAAAPPAAAPPAAEDPAVETLTAMGFPKDKVQNALQAASGNTEMAAEILLTG